ncbi:MAG: hypothetical protein ACD_24C00484G0003, partial [uncultured bacterium]
KIKQMLGWEPENKLEDRLSETVKWYKENGWWWKPLKEGRPLIDPDVQLKRTGKV